MLSKRTLAAAAAAMITVGTMGIGGADAASMTMKPVHHVLVCKAGSAPRLVRVKVHGKWHKVWRCYRVHHKHHHAAPKPTMPKKY